MRVQLSALIIVFLTLLGNLVSYSYEYGNEIEVLREQFKQPFVPNQQEVDFRAAWLKTFDEGIQQRNREEIRWNNFLSHLARKRAEDRARYGDEWNGHVDQMGKYSSDWAREVKYDQYTLESISERLSANRALEGLLESPGHRVHLLGEGDYLVNDVFYAIGYAESPEGIPVWIFISSPKSDEYTEVVETDLKPTVIKFEDQIVFDPGDYGTAFFTYRFRNLEAGEYSAQWSPDFSSWEEFEDCVIEENDERWHEVIFATKQKQVYLRIVKKVSYAEN